MIAGWPTPSVLERCDELARCSEEPGRLTRRFATPALAEARDLVAGWMREAGLEPRCDAVGNLIGRREGAGRDAAARLAPRQRARRGPLRRAARRAGWRSRPPSGCATARCRSRSRSPPSPTRRACATAPRSSAARVLAGRFEPEWLERRTPTASRWPTRSAAGAAIPARSRPGSRRPARLLRGPHRAGARCSTTPGCRSPSSRRSPARRGRP